MCCGSRDSAATVNRGAAQLVTVASLAHLNANAIHTQKHIRYTYTEICYRTRSQLHPHISNSQIHKHRDSRVVSDAERRDTTIWLAPSTLPPALNRSFSSHPPLSFTLSLLPLTNTQRLSLPYPFHFRNLFTILQGSPCFLRQTLVRKRVFYRDNDTRK